MSAAAMHYQNKYVDHRKGFKFSKTKAKCIHFCQLQKRHNDPMLKIDSPEIPLIQQHKFLGNIYTIHEDTENQI